MNVLEKSPGEQLDDLLLPPVKSRRALRLAAELTLDDVAAAVGVSRECIRLYELGLRTPRGRNRRRYIEAMRSLK